MRLDERPGTPDRAVTLGDPERPLRRVSKSLAKLTEALQDMGHQVYSQTIGRLLRQLKFSRQVKADEGRQHPDRDAQFQHINARVLEFQAASQPVISVDTNYARTRIMHGFCRG
jgi:Rhodopirellula transposase DDE domain